MLGALETAGLLPSLTPDVEESVATIDQLRAGLGPEVPEAENPAKELATWLGDRIAVCWGAEGIGAVAAMRWKTQLNENGKVPAWHAAMSELDHNEVVGWVRPTGALHAVIALRTDHEHPRAGGALPAVGRYRARRRCRGTRGARHGPRAAGVAAVADRARRLRHLLRGAAPRRGPDTRGCDRWPEGRARGHGSRMTVGFPAPAGPHAAHRRRPYPRGIDARSTRRARPRLRPRRRAGRRAHGRVDVRLHRSAGCPPTGVPGHAGTLLLGDLAGVPVVAFSGRYPPLRGARPRGAGAAAAARARARRPHDGPDRRGRGPRARRGGRHRRRGARPHEPDGRRAARAAGDTRTACPRSSTPRRSTTRRCGRLALARAAALDVPATEGVYAAMRGPAFETPAEVEMLARLGATVVGMSDGAGIPSGACARPAGARYL